MPWMRGRGRPWMTTGGGRQRQGGEAMDDNRTKRGDGMELRKGQNYTVPETANILRIAEQTLRAKLSKGDKLPRCFRVGTRVLFTGEAIEKFISDQIS